MTKKTFVIAHAHYWIITGVGEVVKGTCKICGTEASFLNFIDWSLIEKKHKPVKEEVEDVDVLPTEE